MLDEPFSRRVFLGGAGKGVATTAVVSGASAARQIDEGTQDLANVLGRVASRGISPAVEATLQSLIPSLRIAQMFDGRAVRDLLNAFYYRRRSVGMMEMPMFEYVPSEQKPALLQRILRSGLESTMFHLPPDLAQLDDDTSMKEWAHGYRESLKYKDKDVTEEAFGSAIKLRGLLSGNQNALNNVIKCLLINQDFLKGKICPNGGVSPWTGKEFESELIEAMIARLNELNPNPSLSEFLKALWGFDNDSAFIKTVRCLDSGMANVGDLMTKFRENQAANIVNVARMNIRRIRQAHQDWELAKAGKPIKENDLHSDVEPVNHNSTVKLGDFPMPLTWGADPNNNLYHKNLARVKWGV